ncbi:MAG TPA: Ig-like domain-containing protein [Terriglobales bacterium]|jgi:hypothetical protein|nr:Ig-like domain-containing protein [Terriglobales bacterium]
MRLKVRCSWSVLFSFLSLLLPFLIAGCGSATQSAKESQAIALNANAPGSPTPGSPPAPPPPGPPPAPGPGDQGNPGAAAPTPTPTPPPTPGPTPPPAPSGSVSVTAPADGATVTSPVQVTASANASSPIATMQVYIDNNLAYQSKSGKIDTALNAGGGPHSLTVQAWDQNGQIYKSSLNVTVSGPGGGNPTFSQIQRIPNWTDCSVCAGHGGSGPTTDHWMEEGVGSPSLSGAAARFTVDGTPWGAALWWKDLQGDTTVSNFKYDLDFYVDRPDQAQALEFDVNQDTGGNRYIYGTECDFGDTQTWRTWNSDSHRWVSTGIYCGRPAAGQWNHLTWELQRNNGQAVFVAVTLNGNRQWVNASSNSYAEGGENMNVAFQADLNASGGSVSVWVDNVNLTTW